MSVYEKIKNYKELVLASCFLVGATALLAGSKLKKTSLKEIYEKRIVLIKDNIDLDMDGEKDDFVIATEKAPNHYKITSVVNHKGEFYKQDLVKIEKIEEIEITSLSKDLTYEPKSDSFSEIVRSMLPRPTDAKNTRIKKVLPVKLEVEYKGKKNLYPVLKVYRGNHVVRTFVGTGKPPPEKTFYAK